VTKANWTVPKAKALLPKISSRVTEYSTEHIEQTTTHTKYQAYNNTKYNTNKKCTEQTTKYADADIATA